MDSTGAQDSDELLDRQSDVTVIVVSFSHILTNSISDSLHAEQDVHGAHPP